MIQTGGTHTHFVMQLKIRVEVCRSICWLCGALGLDTLILIILIFRVGGSSHVEEIRFFFGRA